MDLFHSTYFSDSRSAVVMDLFMGLFSHVTSELTYDADIAGLEYSLESNSRGLALTMTGFNHKLPVRTYVGLSKHS
jgi:secreted Zn-dependent insulinase-like peptidase